MLYIIITVDLSRQKKLDADLKTIQQIDFFEQLKKLDNNGNAILNADDKQSMFVLMILEKINKNSTNILSRKSNNLIKDENYEKAGVKLTNTQLNKLKPEQKISLEQQDKLK